MDLNSNVVANKEHEIVANEPSVLKILTQY